MSNWVEVENNQTQGISSNKAVRFLRWYEKSGDRLVGESLIDAPLSKLQQLLNVASEDQLVDCYPLDPSQLKQLEQVMHRPLEANSYDYFLECDAT